MRVMIDLIVRKPSTGNNTINSNNSMMTMVDGVEVPRKKFIEVHPNQTIWMLKTSIFGAYNIPPARQQAFVKVCDENDPKAKLQAYSKELHNYRLVKDYKINEGSEIQVEVLEKESPTDFIVAPKKMTITGSHPSSPSNIQSGTLHQSMIITSNQQQNNNQNNNINNLSTTLINPTLVAGSTSKVHVLSAKKNSCPALCFALGKGLYRGISGSKYEIKLYRVNSKGMLISSTSHSPFQIEVTKLNSSIDSRMPYIYEQRKSDYSLLILSPQTFGEYSISIKIDDTHICGSPFQCTIIDEFNPMIKELAFSNEWVEEVVELITLMSKKESTLDNLFSFGIDGLINLSCYPDPNIQVHITGVLAKLIEKDKNKERILKECGMEIFFKIVSLETWVSFMELRRFIASALRILISNRGFLNRFFDQCNVDIILLLAKSDSIDCLRSCSIVLCQLSENYEYSERINVDEVKEILVIMIHSKDTITKTCALRAISNISTSIDTKKEINLKLLHCLLDCCRTTTDISIKVLIFKSFSNFCRYESLCIYLFNIGMMELISSSSNDNSAYEMPMYYQWEYNVKQMFANDQQSIEYSVPYSQIFKDESDLTFFLSLTIANMLYTSSSLKIHERFSVSNGLALLKQFVLCYNCSARAESFRCFMLISNSPNDICKKNLINNGIISFLMSSLFDSSSVEIPFIINTISNLCEFDPFCVDSISSDGVEKLISLLCHYSNSNNNQNNNHNNNNQNNNSNNLNGYQPVDLSSSSTITTTTNERGLSGSGGNNNNNYSILLSICIVLSNIASLNDKYRNRIVNRGGKVFLQNLLELVRQGKVSILKPIPPNELVLFNELGRGVSGVVCRAIWNDHQVAVKTISEEALSFDERRFHSEATLTSILSHDNILHSVGGNRTPGKLYLVSDFMSRGSLEDVIKARDVPLSNFKIVHVLLQAAKGMKYLHSLGVIHRDLKSGNLVIDDDWNVRICDFGVSRIIDERRMSKCPGSAVTMSFEVLAQSTDYGLKSDVYSFGVVVWECVSRTPPYFGMEQIVWIPKVLEQGYRLPIPSTCPPELSQIINQCWSLNPDSRPSFAELVDRLQKIKDDMVAHGIFEEFGQSSLASAASLLCNKRYSIFLNENKVNIDLSSHPTELMKSLVMDDPIDQISPDRSTTVSPTSSRIGSPTNSSSSGSSSTTVSPTNQTTSPPIGFVGWKKWEVSQHDKPAKKRISAFRTITKADIHAMSESPDSLISDSPSSGSSSPIMMLMTSPNPSSNQQPQQQQQTDPTSPIPIPLNSSNGSNGSEDKKDINNNDNVNGGDNQAANNIISPNTFSSNFSTLTSESSGVLTSSTNSLSTDNQSFSDTSGYSLPSSLYHQLHHHHHQQHHNHNQPHHGRSYTVAGGMTESAASSRSNSSLSINEGYHPSFNDFEGLTSSSSSNIISSSDKENQIKSSPDLYVSNNQKINNLFNNNITQPPLSPSSPTFKKPVAKSPNSPSSLGTMMKAPIVSKAVIGKKPPHQSPLTNSPTIAKRASINQLGSLNENENDFVGSTSSTSTTSTIQPQSE